MDQTVTKIVEHVFNTAPDSVEQIKDKGKNNLVYKTVVSNKPIILRMNNREETLELYQKEKWCADIVRKAGMLTPEILDVGVLDGYAYSFQEFVEGNQGGETPEDFEKIWFKLGQYSQAINKIPAPDLKIDYRKFIEGLFADDFFIVRNIFSSELSAKIRDRLEETIAWEFSPTLCHGNLRVNNAIFDPAGSMHVIDWETATGNKTPQSELAEIYTWKTGKENVAQFVKGYGLNERDLMDMMRDIQTLVLLRVVNVRVAV